MELKVWVEGLQRIVCGVNEATTCQDVVYALAHATGQTGRFTLAERWRNNERALAPHERPLKVLAKWGEYAADVHLVLRRSHVPLPLSPVPSSSNKTNQAAVKKSLTFTGASQENVNRKSDINHSPVKSQKTDDSEIKSSGIKEDATPWSPGGSPVRHPLGTSRSNHSTTNSPSYSLPSRQVVTSNRQTPPSTKMSPKSPAATPPKVLSATLSPPPYRSPPSIQKTLFADKSRRPTMGVANGHSRGPQFNQQSNDNARERDVQVVFDVHYRDLIRLVNTQRETLSKQHAQITQFDAEIGYWEEKHNEQNRRSEIVDAEMRRLEQSTREMQEEETRIEQAIMGDDVETGIQNERKLSADLNQLKTKLSNCEAELFQCKNKIRILLEELAEERRLLSHAEVERERNLLNEIEDLRREIADKVREYESKVVPLETLAADVAQVEAMIARKKNEVDSLVREIKEANLQSLSVAPEEIKHSEGAAASRAGSTRKMVGSPRQLENAVPTNKNPHGVWV